MKKARTDHQAYLDMFETSKNKFDCHYYDGNPEVHSKMYAWVKGVSPLIGFSGSANYSQYGFDENRQQNQMLQDDPNDITKYYYHLLKNSVHVQDYRPVIRHIEEYENVQGSLPPGEVKWIKENESARISFLTKATGKIAKQHSLNWGQRTGREPNQACLPINGKARNDDFLPPIGLTFTLLTDDGKSFDCTRQQQGGKAISTTYNNSEIGIYFRNRLNVPPGNFVSTQDLINYGRTDFLLKKLDDETYYLDFSKK